MLLWAWFRGGVGVFVSVVNNMTPGRVAPLCPCVYVYVSVGVCVGVGVCGCQWGLLGVSSPPSVCVWCVSVRA